MTTIRIPVVTVSESNSHEHWRGRQRRAKDQRTAVWGTWRVVNPRVTLPVLVRLVRVSPRELDDDNLRGALKHVRDEVAAQLGLPDDRDPRVRWDYGQRKGKPGEKAVVVEIEPA